MKHRTLVMIVGLAAVVADAPARNDLFARPKLVPDTPVEAASAPRSAWRPPLRAIVLAGERSLVKVGNAVVELGGEIDGWRLVRVSDDKAVFARGRERVALTMGGALGEP